MFRLFALLLVAAAVCGAASAANSATLDRPKTLLSMLRARTMSLVKEEDLSRIQDAEPAGDDAFIPFVARQVEPSVTPEVDAGTPLPTPSPTASVTRTPTPTPSVSNTPQSEVPVTPSPSLSPGASPPAACTCPLVNIYTGPRFTTLRRNGLRRVHAQEGRSVFFSRVFLIVKRRNNNNIRLRVVVRAAGRNPGRLPRIIRARAFSVPGFVTFRRVGQLRFRSGRRPGRWVKDFVFNADNYCIGNFYQRTIATWARARYQSRTGRRPSTQELMNFNFYLGCSA